VREVASEVLYRAEGPVARLTINRPERHNALSAGALAGLRQGLAQARADAGVRVVVLAGAGERAFCSGADLSSLGPGRAGVVEGHRARGELARVFEDLWGLGKPSIAQVQGYALAGGFGLALACDLVVASEDATFGAPELDVGLWPHMVTVPLLRAMPAKRALELMLTGRRVSAEEGARIGFVNRVVARDRLGEAVAELAATLASKPPGALALGRDSFYAVVGRESAHALAFLQSMLTVSAMSEEAAEGAAAFAEKREPAWRRQGR